MQRRWMPAFALVVALQIAGAAAFVLHMRSGVPVPPARALIAAPLGAVDELVLDGPVPPAVRDARVPAVRLARGGGHWVLPDYYGAPADPARVEALLARLGALQRGLPVATSPAARERFRVDDDDHERRVRLGAGGRTVGTLYLGRSPDLHQSVARMGTERAVYAVALAAYQLPTKAVDWLDPRLLRRPAGTLVAVGVHAAGQPALLLSRVPSVRAADAPAIAVTAARDHRPASDARPVAERARRPPAWQAPGWQLDPHAVDTLLQAIAHIRVDEILGTVAQPAWHQDRPELVLELDDRAGRVETWTFSRPEAGDYRVLKVSGRPWYFRLGAWNAEPLLDAAMPLHLARSAPPSDNPPFAAAAATANPVSKKP